MPIYKRSIIIAIAVVMMLGFISPALAWYEIWTPHLVNLVGATIEYDGKTYKWVESYGHVKYERDNPIYDQLTEFYWTLKFVNKAPPYDMIFITGTETTGLKEVCGDPCPDHREGGYGLTPDETMGRWRGLDSRLDVEFYGRWTTIDDYPLHYFDYIDSYPPRVRGLWILDGSDDGKAEPAQYVFTGVLRGHGD